MANITQGPQWRKYEKNDQWKVVLVGTLAVMMFAYLFVHAPQLHPRRPASTQIDAVIGGCLMAFLVAWVGPLKREVFVDTQAAFVSVTVRWLGYRGHRMVPFSEIQSVSAYMVRGSGGGKIGSAITLLVANGKPIRLGIVGSRSRTRQEAEWLGAALNKPVNMDPMIACA